ncbi:AzlC family ABC transporter permease [Vibrio caribbeanicus]|uniref:AzlC family ABC transporter permease n=1 Tax=Vibrio caribbeanicus TaxID=701175 RepID=UPI0022850C66|nr:AzlC family ABC transporter permease [Vibrio caribbeanicus]MCY9843893.1 AzlC family ABC transporter permease [Vibrio caribbeanicus]
MNAKVENLEARAWLTGIKDAIPLMGGYIPVAISFGLISLQAGFGIWETIMISILIYAGASQFLFVAMVASGAPLWLVVSMTLMINARHVVYGPNLAPYLSKNPWWIALMHGLTDQIFALAHARLPQIAELDRLGWFIGCSILGWLSWVGGTALGAFAGEGLISRWPLLGDVLPFALPALFFVLLIPRFNSMLWVITLLGAIVSAICIKLYGLTNLSIPLGAAIGACLYYLVRNRQTIRRSTNEL